MSKVDLGFAYRYMSYIATGWRKFMSTDKETKNFALWKTCLIPFLFSYLVLDET